MVSSILIDILEKTPTSDLDIKLFVSMSPVNALCSRPLVCVFRVAHNIVIAGILPMQLLDLSFLRSEIYSRSTVEKLTRSFVNSPRFYARRVR